MAAVLHKFYVKRRQNLPEIKQFFCNLCQFTKFRFWWIVDCSFNGIKLNFIQFFVHVDPYVYYTMYCCIVFCIALIEREQTM